MNILLHHVDLITRHRHRGQIEVGVITAINDKPVHSSNDLFNALEKYKAGDTVKVTYRRGNTTTTAEAKLQ